MICLVFIIVLYTFGKQKSSNKKAHLWWANLLGTAIILRAIVVGPPYKCAFAATHGLAFQASAIRQGTPLAVGVWKSFALTHI